MALGQHLKARFWSFLKNEEKTSNFIEKQISTKNLTQKNNLIKKNILRKKCNYIFELLKTYALKLFNFIKPNNLEK